MTWRDFQDAESVRSGLSHVPSQPVFFSVWKEFFIKVLKMILQGEDKIHWTITILCTNLFQAMKTTSSWTIIGTNRDLREDHMQSLYEMEELLRVQELRVDGFSRRRLIEDRDIILELTARIQELQNEVNCLNDSRDF